MLLFLLLLTLIISNASRSLCFIYGIELVICACLPLGPDGPGLVIETLDPLSVCCDNDVHVHTSQLCLSMHTGLELTLSKVPSA